MGFLILALISISIFSSFAMQSSGELNYLGLLPAELRLELTNIILSGADQSLQRAIQNLQMIPGFSERLADKHEAQYFIQELSHRFGQYSENAVNNVARKLGKAKPIQAWIKEREKQISLEKKFIQFSQSAEDIGNLKELLAKKVSINAQDNEGKTALHWASQLRRADVIQFLLKKGADPNLQDVQGITPLMYAVNNNHSTIIELLLEKGADPTLKDKNGKNSLDYALHANNGIYRLLESKTKK